MTKEFTTSKLPQPADAENGWPADILELASQLADTFWRIHPSELDRLGYVRKDGPDELGPRARFYRDQIAEALMKERRQALSAEAERDEALMRLAEYQTSALPLAIGDEAAEIVDAIVRQAGPTSVAADAAYTSTLPMGGPLIGFHGTIHEFEGTSFNEARLGEGVESSADGKLGVWLNSSQDMAQAFGPSVLKVETGDCNRALLHFSDCEALDEQAKLHPRGPRDFYATLRKALRMRGVQAIDFVEADGAVEMSVILDLDCIAKITPVSAPSHSPANR